MDNKEISPNQNSRSRLFRPPWKYREGFIVALALMLLGFAIEAVTPQPGISIPSFPFNMYAGMAFVTTIVFLHLFYRDMHMVRWLSTIPSAVSAICLIVLLTILMGVFEQDRPDAGGIHGAIGLTHMKNAWVFLLAQLYLLVSLGLAILKRAFPFRKKNTGFLLNHLGLWIVIAGGSLGTGDLQRYRMDLYEDEPVWYAYDSQSNYYEMPFALELINFDIEEYPPQLAIVDSHTGRLTDDSQRPLPYIEAGKTTQLMEWTIHIDEFYPMALPENGRVAYSEEKGAPPYARVRVANNNTGETHEGWISCGSFMYDTKLLWLDGRNVLVMTLPEPRRYLSNVIALTPREDPRELVIEVNKPPKVAGWRLYQLSYNQAMGKWSDVSVIEAVRDPWLPVVYAGIIMLFAGAAYIFWIGKEIKDEGPVTEP